MFLSRDHIGGRVRLLDSLAIFDSVTSLSKSSCFVTRFLVFRFFWEEEIDAFAGALRAALEAWVRRLSLSKGSFLFLKGCPLN